MIVSFFDFRRRFHNETIVFKKNENVNNPTWNFWIEEISLCLIG